MAGDDETCRDHAASTQAAHQPWITINSTPSRCPDRDENGAGLRKDVLHKARGRFFFSLHRGRSLDGYLRVATVVRVVSVD